MQAAHGVMEPIESIPFSVKDNVDHPISWYAASKKSNELIAHSYSNLFNLPTTWFTIFYSFMAHGEDQIKLFLNLQKLF